MTQYPTRFFSLFLLLVLLAVVPKAAAVSDTSRFVLPFSARTSTTLVRDLTGFSNVSRFVRSDDETALVFVYDSLDVNSMRVAAQVEAGASLLKGFVNVYGADIRDPSLRWLVAAWGVQFTPLLLGFGIQRATRKQFDSSTGLSTFMSLKRPVEFNQPEYKAEQIKIFGLSLLSAGYIQRVEDENRMEQMRTTINPSAPYSIYGDITVPHVVLFTNKEATSQLFKALSIRFYRRVGFFELHAKKLPQAAENFGVPPQAVPCLLLFRKNVFLEENQQTVEQYRGKLNIEDISVFLEASAVSVEKKEQLQWKEASVMIKTEFKRQQHPVLPIETRREWQSEVVRRNTITGVFLANDQSEDFKEKLATLEAIAAKRTKSKAATVSRYVFVDTSTPFGESCLEYFFKEESSDVSSEPQLIFLSMKKLVYTRFIGAFSEEGINGFISRKLASGVGAKKFDPQHFPLPEEEEE